MRGYLSLAIVWTQFLSCCIDHRQGVAEGGHIWGGGGILVLMDTGERLEHTAYFFCVDRKAGGPWRALQKEKELEWVGFCPCSLAFSFPALFMCTMK